MVDINAYAGYIVPAIAIISLCLSLYNFTDKFFKERLPHIRITIDDNRANAFDWALKISATNDGLRTVVISSCDIEIMEPKDIYWEDYQRFNDLLNSNMPYKLLPNDSFCSSISVMQLSRFVGSKKGLKFKIVFVIDGRRYNSRSIELSGEDCEEIEDFYRKGYITE